MADIFNTEIMVQGSVRKSSSGGTPTTFEEAKTRAQNQRKGRARVRSTLSRASFKDLFSVGERLGGGAYASVWSCMRRYPLNEKEKHQQFAVKIIENIPTHSRQRCLNEVELFFKCRSNKHIIRVEETFDESDAFYIIFEKVDGGPLMNAISRCKTITERDVVNVMKELADAVAFLHGINIAHRDLKPDNILCVSTDSLSPVKLCDLDLGSKIELNHSKCGMTPLLMTPVGSAEYMAPEVVEGFVSDEAGPYDKRCDLWSLGVVLYILLCGYPPFVGSCGENCDWAKGGDCANCQNSLFSNIQEGIFHFPKKDWGKIDPNAMDLVRRLLIKDPKQRISAQMILEHPWIVSGGSDTEVNTPYNINNMNFGCDKVSQFASTAMELHSIHLQHMDINFDSESSSESDDTLYGSSPPSHCSVSPTSTDSAYFSDEAPISLSPPTASVLLQRRSLERRQELEKELEEEVEEYEVVIEEEDEQEEVVIEEDEEEQVVIEEEEVVTEEDEEEEIIIEENEEEEEEEVEKDFGEIATDLIH